MDIQNALQQILTPAKELLCHSGAATVFGYFFAVVAGHYCIRRLMDELRDGIRPELDDRQESVRFDRFPEHSAIVGIFERSLYVASLQLGLRQPDTSSLALGFIALWIGLKTAANWTRWERERRTYNLFLIGNGLSIMYAAIGAFLIPQAGEEKCIIAWLGEEKFTLAALAAIVVIGGTILLQKLAKGMNVTRRCERCKCVRCAAKIDDTDKRRRKLEHCVDISSNYEVERIVDKVASELEQTGDSSAVERAKRLRVTWEDIRVLPLIV